MRKWIALALLSGSWLFGLGYFSPAHAMTAVGMLVVSMILLADTPIPRLPVGHRLAALTLLLPVLWFVPGQAKWIAIVLALGTCASFAPATARWLRRGANGAWVAGMVLTCQGLVIYTYRIFTARQHELPNWSGQLLAALARQAGVEASWDASMIVLRSGATTVRAALTWELLFDPGTVCFLASAILLLLLLQKMRYATTSSAWPLILKLLAIYIIWVPLRAMLVVSLVVQQQLRATPITDPNAGELFVSTWLHTVLLLAFALVCGMTLRPRAVSSQSATRRHHVPAANIQIAAVALCFVGVMLITFTHYWVATGQRNAGRVMVVERHSSWEPTTEPYGDKVYGEAGSYNYAAAFEYCSQYFDMSRLLPQDTIDLETLQQCDVLVIKTPTERYSPQEAAAVVEYVNQGGALLMIGDHTNVFNMCTYLNDMARPLGFCFRNDLLFSVGDPYRQKYHPPRVRHPILQYMPAMDFAVSCSIEPGTYDGDMVIQNVGLYNLPPAYEETNYHPQAEYRPDMQYGAWCQLWASSHGQGRVVAFADSTLFSNFCVFQPGKAELLIGMLEWLNHRSPFDSTSTRRLLTVPLQSLGVGLLLISWFLMRGHRTGWLLLLTGGLAAWAIMGWAVDTAHRQAMPLPDKRHELQHIVIDRTVSEVPLFTGAFADDAEGNGYGMLEQWIPRVGGYISRGRGIEVFAGDALVMICPTHIPSQRYREALVHWVQQGGHLLVFDSPELQDSSANSILNLFDLATVPGTPKPDGEMEPVQTLEGGAATPLAMSCVVSGGEPIARWGDSTVAARTTVGKGRVTVVGFSSLFNDANMGYHWLSDPDEPLQKRYDVLYALLRSALHDRHPPDPDRPEQTEATQTEE